MARTRSYSNYYFHKLQKMHEKSANHYHKHNWTDTSFDSEQTSKVGDTQNEIYSPSLLCELYILWITRLMSSAGVRASSAFLTLMTSLSSHRAPLQHSFLPLEPM
uniref:Succinate dehydrogenase assembly factor 3 n=1 Tax=Schistocephalus solidus TaxID=70667 RepID=A0A0V0J8F3_SCHSO